MSETLGYVEHQSVFCRQFDAEPPTKSRRIRPQINDDVIERATDAAHDLAFCKRRQLKMHTAKCTGVGAERVVDLNNRHGNASGLEFLLTEEASKETAVIPALFGLNRVGTEQWRRVKFHQVGLSALPAKVKRKPPVCDVFL